MSAGSEGANWVMRELLAASANSKMQLAGSFLGMSTDSAVQQGAWATQGLATGLDSVMGYLKAKREMFPPGQVVRWSNLRGDVVPLLMKAGIAPVMAKAGLSIAQNPKQAATTAFVGASGMLALDIYLTAVCPPAGAAAWIFTGAALLADVVCVYSAINGLPKPDAVKAAMVKRKIAQGAAQHHFYDWKFDAHDPNQWFSLTSV